MERQIKWGGKDKTKMRFVLINTNGDSFYLFSTYHAIYSIHFLEYPQLSEVSINISILPIRLIEVKKLVQVHTAHN